MISDPAEYSPVDPDNRDEHTAVSAPPGDSPPPREDEPRVLMPNISSAPEPPPDSGASPNGRGRSSQPLRENGASSQRPRTVRGPFSGFILAVAVTGTVIAAVWGLVTNRQVPVLVAVSDLPAYHEVTLNDLTMDTRAVLGENDYVTLPVDGRITLKNLKKGQPLLNTDLSPKIQGMVRGDLRVVGLDVSRGDVLGGALQSGDPVLVLLIERGHPPRELRAVVLSASSAGATTTNWSLVLVMNGREARNHAATLARNDVLILRNPKATVFR